MRGPLILAFALSSLFPALALHDSYINSHARRSVEVAHSHRRLAELALAHRLTERQGLDDLDVIGGVKDILGLGTFLSAPWFLFLLSYWIGDEG